MLLQIQEPSSSESLPPREFKLALGIDLGTTNSVAAAVGDDGAPKVFCDENGRALVPSAVHYAADSAPLVGEAAMAKRRDDPENVICSVQAVYGAGGGGSARRLPLRLRRGRRHGEVAKPRRATKARWKCQRKSCAFCVIAPRRRPEWRRRER